ncbi:Ankyrin repeat-containing protein [Camellia lanceoleosa]|nr:Ankyrin repeat-containing protein [Camellia lanceoleosa]
MDPVLYRAAKEGDKVVLEQYVDQLEAQVTPNENTVLHIAAQFGNSQCVREILSKNSSLLNRQNAKGDTALHVAARDGHSDIVKSLIECATLLDRDHVEIESGSEITKKMLRATNYDGDTALHDAVRYRHPDLVIINPFKALPIPKPLRPKTDLVRLLIDEDPEFTYPANNAGETLLYIAAERGYHEVVSDISKTCRAPAYDGPGGRTALHAAVISNNEGGTKTLLDWKKDLAKEPDMHGWTPLHYAARFGHVHRAKQLLDSDKSIAYLIADQDDNKTALHVAASQGHVSVIQELISQCPDCWEMVNHKGQNILHVAVENEKREVLMKKVLEKAGATLGLRNVISKDNEFLANKKKEQAEFEKPIPHFDMRKEGDTLLLVATLVATVTFAAGFTMPGGYNSNDGPNQGMAVLTREAAFKAFVVTDSIAMIFSTCAVLIHFLLADYEDQTKLPHPYEVATYLLMIATGAMVLAFITGICAVLPHSSSLAIPICIIGCFPFVIYYWLFKDIFDMVLASFDVPISLNAFKDRTSRKAFS